jgi:hypothetical protein
MARVITHAMFTSSLCYASCHHDVMYHAIMMLCIISCIYETQAASSSSHCLTSLYFFFFLFFVIITYSLPYHDSYQRSDVTACASAWCTYDCASQATGRELSGPCHASALSSSLTSCPSKSNGTRFPYASLGRPPFTASLVTISTELASTYETPTLLTASCTSASADATTETKRVSWSPRTTCAAITSTQSMLWSHECCSTMIFVSIDNVTIHHFIAPFHRIDS